MRSFLSKQIDEIYTWLDLDDDEMKTLTKSSSDTSSTFSQEILILSFDLFHKVFGSGTGNERITNNVYEIWTSPEHATTLISILYKASQPTNHPTVQFIPYSIQRITNRDIHKTVIQKENTLSEITTSSLSTILKKET